MNEFSQLLLLLGVQRSGTTLLSAILGRHSEINMLFESTTNDVFTLIGKKYSGNKLLTWRQIRYKQRSSKFGHAINRLANFHLGTKYNKHHKRRPFPTSELAITDYLNKKAKIITLFRNKEEVVKSIISRTTQSRKQAEREYEKGLNELLKVKDLSLHIDFYDLIHHTKKTLQTICNYLQLEFEEKMLDGSTYNFVYPNNKVIEHKAGSKFEST